MSVSIRLHRGRMPALLLATALVVGACGGGASTSDTPTSQNPPAVATTGTVGLLFTDKATDEFSEIKFHVIEAVLIGGESLDGQHVLFTGGESMDKSIDLLKLENFSEPIIFGEVPAGVYTKLRLYIDNLELVPMDGGSSIFPSLPANGKIDLLDPSGIPVLPGRTLLIELDMEANKAFKITRAGNSMRVNFRPVVKTRFYNGDIEGGLPYKLARIEGTVAEVYTDPAGSFRLCDLETPDSCIDVNTNSDTSIFDNMGADTDLSTLMETNEVVVIGRYMYDSAADNGRIDPELFAFIIEIGGNAAQIRGSVVSAPDAGQFLFVADDGTDYSVELQTGTKFFDMNMVPPAEVDGGSITVGTDIEIEGVATAGTPDVIRAALVLITNEDDEELGGTIAAGTLVADADPSTGGTFDLTLADSSTTPVCVVDGADILFVDTAASAVTTGAFSDLADNMAVELFGSTGAACFEAGEVLVDGPPPAP